MVAGETGPGDDAPPRHAEVPPVDEAQRRLRPRRWARARRLLRVRATIDRIRDSLLLLPLAMLVVTVLLEEAIAGLDRRLGEDAPIRFSVAPGTASTLLATIAGATITTAGVVFSLLVVSLQLASGQFSPRVLRTYWRDWEGHVLIGLLLSTFLFCMLALAQIEENARHAPTLTMQAALLLTLSAIIGIAVYLNRIAHEQYVGRIAQRIMQETLRLVGQLPYGTGVGTKVGEECAAPVVTQLGPPLVIVAEADGWVQQLGRNVVVDATPEGSVVKIDTRIGAYVVRGEPLVIVWPHPGPEEAARTTRRASDAIMLGDSRSMQQDIDFGLRQLTDIALRALSPAVNDPTTAIEVVLRIASTLRPLVTAPLPPRTVAAPGGRVVLTPWDLDHASYVAHGFGQLRIYAAPHPQVVIAMVRALTMLRAAATAAGNGPAATACETQLQLVVEGAERAGLLPADLALIRQASGDLIEDRIDGSSRGRRSSS